jgi:2-amino-4-hydroxy-6-hydroxymethyldihydropteridine diphosphokinase
VIPAYIALGANLGDRAGNIRTAVEKLGATQGLEIGARSSLLENPAVGGPVDSPAFLNGVVSIHTTLAPEALLARLLEIESQMGRRRRERWEPRVIDLDLLIYGEQIVDTPGLTLPHPRLHQRRFVLAPLAEIAPSLVHPQFGKTIARLLDELPPGA